MSEEKLEALHREPNESFQEQQSVKLNAPKPQWNLVSTETELECISPMNLNDKQKYRDEKTMAMPILPVK